MPVIEVILTIILIVMGWIAFFAVVGVPTLWLLANIGALPPSLIQWWANREYEAQVNGKLKRAKLEIDNLYADEVLRDKNDLR